MSFASSFGAVGWAVNWWLKGWRFKSCLQQSACWSVFGQDTEGPIGSQYGCQCLAWQQPIRGVWICDSGGEWEANVKNFEAPWQCWETPHRCNSFTVCSFNIRSCWDWTGRALLPPFAFHSFSKKEGTDCLLTMPLFVAILLFVILPLNIYIYVFFLLFFVRLASLSYNACIVANLSCAIKYWTSSTERPGQEWHTF